jgi:hypothetical protein
MNRILNNIIKFRSIVLKTWIKDRYKNNKDVTKEVVFDLCLDAYLRGMSDALEGNPSVNT